ncbi:MAG: PIG-L family deacetylase [bacterium]|nr:PIG-L family deacetylase [bacterium]
MPKPKLVAIFAHPDDEAFGPAGTIATYSKTHEVSLICATRGEAGENSLDDKSRSIGEIREEELRASAKLLGVTHVYFLDYEDGSLCNNKYHDIADKVKNILDSIEPEILLTFEIRGVSGHLDHVAMAMITYYLFYKVPYAKKLMSYVLMREETDLLRDYFIYVPHGFKRDRVDEIVDVGDLLELKKQAIMVHKSQQPDVSRTLAMMDSFPKEEFFLVHKKTT